MYSVQLYTEQKYPIPYYTYHVTNDLELLYKGTNQVSNQRKPLFHNDLRRDICTACPGGYNYSPGRTVRRNRDAIACYGDAKPRCGSHATPHWRTRHPCRANVRGLRVLMMFRPMVHNAIVGIVRTIGNSLPLLRIDCPFG